MTRIAIGLCTLGRPQMLARCLQSIAMQTLPDDAELAVILVDNDLLPEAYPVASRIPMPWQLHYVHEPVRGISRARNAVLTEARRIGAEWVLMVDDDQWLEPHSLKAAWTDAKGFRADAVSLAFIAEFPHPRPFWCVPDYFDMKHGHGQALRQCGTGGVLFRLREHMRFDESLGLNGGEDTAFFYGEYMRGARIIASTRAKVHEEVIPSRMTYRFQCYRDYCNAAANLRMHRTQKGVRAVPARAWKAASRLCGGIVEAPLLPLYAAVSLPHFKRRALKVGKKLSWAAGVAAGLSGRVPEPYRNVAGY